MSAIENSNSVWSIPDTGLDPKYEKCRNITEEIYKRINITFEIKKLETATQSDISEHRNMNSAARKRKSGEKLKENARNMENDQIDSNELSNETDLFACDKSDSIISSTEAERPPIEDKYININNNEEQLKKTVAVCRRPKKRFRKRVKKRQSKHRSDSDGSSDEALPLSRMLDVDTKSVTGDSPINVMGVPKIVIVTKDFKPKIITPEKLQEEKKLAEAIRHKHESKDQSVDKIDRTVDKRNTAIDNVEESSVKCAKVKSCSVCNLTFRGERGLRRHMTMSHINDEKPRKGAKLSPEEEKP